MVFCNSKKKSEREEEEYQPPPIRYLDKPCNECSVICPGFALVLLAIIGFGVIYKQIDTINYKPFDCVIENVTYSTLIVNMSDPNDTPIAHNFVRCDCGRKCISQYGTCIKLWGRDVANPLEPIRMIQDSTTKAEQQCTFQEETCSNGESVLNRINAVSANQERALRYLNTTQTCYTKNNETYYLSNSMNKQALITGCVLFGLILLCCCGVICHYLCFFCKQRENVKNKNKVHIVHIENGSFKV